MCQGEGQAFCYLVVSYFLSPPWPLPPLSLFDFSLSFFFLLLTLYSPSLCLFSPPFSSFSSSFSSSFFLSPTLSPSLPSPSPPLPPPLCPPPPPPLPPPPPRAGIHSHSTGYVNAGNGWLVHAGWGTRSEQTSQNTGCGSRPQGMNKYQHVPHIIITTLKLCILLGHHFRFYPVHICAAGLSIWFCLYVCVHVYVWPKNLVLHLKAGSQYDDSPSFRSISSLVVVTSYCEL